MNVGKILILAGAALIVVGLIFWLVGKIGIPGDIKFSLKKYGSTFYFPIVSSLIASIVLSILINLLFYFYRK